MSGSPSEPPAGPRTRPERPGARPRRRRRPARRWSRRIPVWAVPIVVVAVLLAGEGAARVVGPEIPRKAGTEERLLVKSDQIYQRGTGSTDVVLIGSSETAAGLIPAQVDRAVPQFDGIYNAGLSGMELTITKKWAERIVVPNLKPKVVVIGLLPISLAKLDAEGADKQKQAIRAYSSAIEQVDPGGIGSLGWKLRQYSAIIRYRPYLRSPSLAVKGLWSAVRGGHEVTAAERAADTTMEWSTETDPRRVARNTAHDGEIYDYRSESIPTESDAIGARLYELFGRADTDFSKLDALVTRLQDQGTTVVIALAPIDRAPLEAAGADLGPLDRVAGEIEAWGKQHDVAVDDQFTVAWDSELFHDRNHVDLEGAKRWSTEVGTFLAKLCRDGKLPDACSR